MHAARRQLNKPLALGLACLLLALLLCGCGLLPMPANSGPDPNSEATVEPAPTPTPDPEALARKQRLSEAKDGFVWDDGSLQAIDAEGNLRTDCWIGVLHFGKDGRYTSGSRELDELTAAVVRDNTDLSMTRMEMLRAMYDYSTSHIRYVGLANYEYGYQPAHGKDGWMPSTAVKTLNDGYGNCYCYAAVFAALARAVGYQAYAVGGIVGATEDPPGWVEIVDEDGNIWMNDPEIEYRFGDYYKSVQSKETAPDLFYKSEDMIGAATGFSYRAFRDPFEAEAKEAEERESGIAEDTASATDKKADSAPEIPEESPTSVIANQ